MADWDEKANEMFLRAIEIDSDEQRARYLDQACAADADLRASVETLLKAHTAAGTFLNSPANAAVALASELNPTLVMPPGTAIGRYKLLEPIGEGGYGTVFMAEQTSPVHRKVALKLIKAGMDTRQVIARFEAERQALALMDHPNIAKVFDAGVTDTGRPYFVMELVKGMPITKYCDEHHVQPRQRLELFAQVCQAVQHAHTKGIIHRDLKPTNVLVAQYDGKPVPKVIDFGVAKATGQQLTDLTMFTGFGDVIGTLEYMSPEQAEVNQLDVDTRSDIYSLGVLLYELLTGSTPLEHKRVMKAGLLEMLRVVREEALPRPSMRLTASEQLPSIAANRGLEPKKLSGLVKGELDWIVMKSLEKDRARRYETANGFATDVQRYLDDEAVHACPPSARYRFRKFARRNKGPLTAAAMFAAVLVAATVFSTWQALRATKAEGLAETRLNGEAQARREAVDARNQAQANLGKAREAVQQITRIGDHKLSSVPQMEGVRRELLESALQFYVDLLQQESNDREIRRETAIAYGRAAEIHRYLGNTSKAHELIRESIARLEKLATESASTPADRATLVGYYNALAHYGIAPGDEMVATLRRAIRMAEQLVKEFPDDPKYKHDLSRLYSNVGRYLAPTDLKEAERYMRHSLRLAEEMGDQVAVAGTSFDLGFLLKDQANPEAEQWLRRSLAIWEKHGTESSWHREMAAKTLTQLGDYLFFAGKPREAADAFRRSADLWLPLMKDYPSIAALRTQCAQNYWFLGRSLSAAGQEAQADAAYQRALDLTPQDASLHNTLAWRLATSADAKLRDPGRALQLATRAAELSPESGLIRNTLGVARYRAGEFKQAVADLEQSIQLRKGGSSADFFFLAMAHWQLGDKDLAHKWHAQGVEWMDKNNPKDEQLVRFRAEADELLKVSDQKPTTKPQS